MQNKRDYYLGNPNLPTENSKFEWTPKMLADLKKAKHGYILLGDEGFGLAVIIGLTRVVYSKHMISIESEQIFLNELLNNIQIIGGWMEQENCILPPGSET